MTTCGCGERTSGGVFRPGHDQKLRTSLENRAGGLSGLARLVDAAEHYADGRLPLEDFGKAVQRVFAQ